MTQGMMQFIEWACMSGVMVGQYIDYRQTITGIQTYGEKEVGLINRLFIKSAADLSKLPLITFIESGVLLAVFGLLDSLGKPIGDVALPGGGKFAEHDAYYGMVAAISMLGARVAGCVWNWIQLRKAEGK
jgi:hypothetical protein